MAFDSKKWWEFADIQNERRAGGVFLHVHLKGIVFLSS